MRTNLTKSERKIAILLFWGYSRKMIAEKLHRTTGTIQRHESNMYAKIGAHNRSDLFRYLITDVLNVDLGPLKNELNALACLLFVLFIEFGNVDVLRVKSQNNANVARVSRSASKTGKNKREVAYA